MQGNISSDGHHTHPNRQESPAFLAAGNLRMNPIDGTIQQKNTKPTFFAVQEIGSDGDAYFAFCQPQSQHAAR
jgi:hypothetical protein